MSFGRAAAKREGVLPATYQCWGDHKDLTAAVEAAARDASHDVVGLQPGEDGQPIHLVVNCPIDKVDNLFTFRHSNRGTIRGSPVATGDQKLQEASADALVQREARGIAATSAFIGQIAIVGTFLGAFSLLNESAKTAVFQSPLTVGALAFAAVSMAFSMATYIFLPSAMPPFSHIDELRTFWNQRVAQRKFLLQGAFLFLLVAILLAVLALRDARHDVAPKPAATVGGKYTPAAVATSQSSLEATAAWTGLDKGTYTLTCVQLGSEYIGASVGVADDAGKQTTTLTVPVKPPSKDSENVTISADRLSSAPPATQAPSATCQTRSLTVGQPTKSTITVQK
jgi:hypothetical protein